MSEWVLLEKKNRGGGVMLACKEWHSVPCVAVSKGRLSFNPTAIKTFGWNGDVGSLMVLFRSGEKRAVGFKVPMTDDEKRTAFALLKNGPTSQTRALSLKTKTEYADCVGRQYRLHLNPGERVVVAELTPENMAK